MSVHFVRYDYQTPFIEEWSEACCLTIARHALRYIDPTSLSLLAPVVLYLEGRRGLHKDDWDLDYLRQREIAYQASLIGRDQQRKAAMAIYYAFQWPPSHAALMARAMLEQAIINPPEPEDGDFDCGKAALRTADSPATSS